MRILLIIYSENCWNSLQKYDSSSTIVISFIRLKQTNTAEVIYVQDFLMSDECENVYLSNVKLWLKQLEKVNKISQIYGYVNTIYENAFLPFIKLFEILNTLKKRYGKSLILYSAGNNKLNFYSLPFYLAEGESAARFFYDRRAIYSPYVKKWVRSHNIKHKILQNYVSVKIPIHNILRLYMVLIGRAAADILYSIKLQGALLKNSSNQRTSACEKDHNILVIVRNEEKLRLSQAVCQAESLNSRYLIGSTMVAKWTRFIYSNCNLKTSSVIFLKYKTWSILTDTLSTFVKINKLKVPTFDGPGLSFRPTQIAKELVVQSRHSYNYEKAIRQELYKNFMLYENISYLMTYEQKGIYAAIDAKVGKSMGWKTIQLITNDQDIRKLPAPVFGDLVLFESEKTMNKWASKNPNFASKMDFYDSRQFVVTKKEPCVDKDLIKRICFFGTARPELNNDILHQLRPLKKHFELFYKPHPRVQKTKQDGDYFKVISCEDPNEALSQVDLCVTVLSSSVNYILLSNTPIVIIGDNNYWSSESLKSTTYWYPEYLGCLQSSSGIREILTKRLEELLISYQVIRNKYLSEYDRNKKFLDVLKTVSIDKDDK